MTRLDVVRLNPDHAVDAIPAADLLFGFISKVYKRRSLIVTTNLPFAKWSEVFLDATAAAAVIDRIVHHATVLKVDGESFRLRAAAQRGAKKGGGKR